MVSPPYISSQIQPTPYCKEYFDALKGRITYIEGSRGCPYNCAFCLSGQCGSKVQYYPTQRTKDELLLLANSGTQTIKFVDRTFNANPKRAKELFRFILDNYGSKIPQGVCIHFEVAGDILDDEELYLLSQMPTGAVQLEIGLQSFNEKTLSAINRKTNTEKLKKNIAALTAMKNMHIHIDLIAGLPYEDIKSFEQSFNTAFALQPNMLQLGFLKVLWGSAIGDNPENFGCQYSQKPPYQVINTTWLSHEDMKTLHTMEDATERLYNSGRFCQTIKYVLSASGLSPYQMFKGFGDFCSNYVLENISLNDYTELVFNGMNMLLKADDQQLLRDKMICDRLSTIADSKLPPVLRVPDQRYKQIKNYMAAHNAPPLPGVKRCMAILYFSGRVVYADYKDKDPVSGKYKLNYIALNDIFP